MKSTTKFSLGRPGMAGAFNSLLVAMVFGTVALAAIGLS